MPVLIPIIAAGAAYFGTGLVLGTAFGVAMSAAVGSVVAGVIVGAVIGAAVGAIGAAVTGGDIGEGALWGAIGGAVAGGFAGFGAGAGAVTGEGMTVAGEGSSGFATQSMGTGGAGAGASKGLGDVATAALITTGGETIAGYANGAAAGDIAVEDRAEAERVRQETFEQQMKQIGANHENRMKEIGAQTDTSLALADKNNAASMDQLNTRIGADSDTAAAVISDRESEQGQLNDSILGTDANLFDRPTFKFENTASFDSGFEEAAEQSPNATPLTPEEQLALEQIPA